MHASKQYARPASTDRRPATAVAPTPGNNHGSCSPPPEVLHQLHRVAVVHLHLIHVHSRDGQPRPRQQVAAVPHLRAAGGQGKESGLVANLLGRKCGNRCWPRWLETLQLYASHVCCTQGGIHAPQPHLRQRRDARRHAAFSLLLRHCAGDSQLLRWAEALWATCQHVLCRGQFIARLGGHSEAPCCHAAPPAASARQTWPPGTGRPA